MSRVKNTLKNMTNGMAAYGAKLIVQFWCRRLFVLFLGEVYLGLNGLFSNILMLLSLAEMGVGSAITFSLYKPLAEKNEGEIRSLMALFKKAYVSIGIFVAAVGLSLTPFLQVFVKDMPDLPHIKLIYMLYVINSAASYFFTYKRTLIIADQREYIVSRYSGLCSVAMNISQLIVLYITKNFIAYLLTMIFYTVLENLLLSIRANKLYPFLNEGKSENLPREKIQEITKNVKALICHQVGRVVVNGTDNLIMAKMVDLVSVGKYSNYIMIRGALESVVGSFYRGVFASVGNVNATETDEVKKQIFDRINFLTHWIFGFCAICLFCLFNHFIGSIWLGKSFLFSDFVVFCICLDFLVYGFRNPVLITKNAMGLYWNDRFKPIFEAGINLVVSIYFTKKIGVAGIVLGTVISSLSTNLWIEPLILYKEGFHAPVSDYFKDYGKAVLMTAAAGVPTWLLCSLLPAEGILPFIGKAFICLLVPNIIFLLLRFRNENFKYFTVLGKRLLSR